jgi:hypothetical protein
MVTMGNIKEFVQTSLQFTVGQAKTHMQIIQRMRFLPHKRWRPKALNITTWAVNREATMR